MTIEQTPEFKIFPINSRPYGLTYEQWSIEWWSWLLTIPKEHNPVYDNNGTNASVNQENSSVFFLCQTFNENGSNPTRSVNIKMGNSLFFPLINWISVSPEDGLTTNDLVMKAKSKMNSIADLKIIVNGDRIIDCFSKYRVQTDSFFVNLPMNNILGVKAGPSKIASDGFWILTKPISKSLCLTTFGSCSTGRTKIGVNYKITVT